MPFPWNNSDLHRSVFGSMLGVSLLFAGAAQADGPKIGLPNLSAWFDKQENSDLDETGVLRPVRVDSAFFPRETT